MKLTPKRAVIFDDQRLFSESFCVALLRLGMFDDVSVVLSDGELAGRLRNEEKEEIYFFVSASIRKINVFHLVEETRRIFPAVTIIFCMNSENYGVISRVQRLEANAIISKRDSFGDLKKCLERIGEKALICSPSIEAVIHTAETEGVCYFTAREIEVLFLLYEGKNTEQIAGIMHLSRHTIATHKRNMMTKSNTRSMGELLAFARRYFDIT
ncbi:response regulator transcription factor [Siphonobacter aquaeclarae]|uniref:response regulator transcription factor n=1 Tax=Siphonobacter aquaeclarae TaxID=563176 RepID=UPI001C40B8D2|nr:LuxR C-terminal-related transcriptional regulator [Siphonobacter aquaeclarae]